jgi:hypothetical protein
MQLDRVTVLRLVTIVAAVLTFATVAYAGTLAFQDPGYQTESGVSFSQETGPSVTLGVDTEVNSEYPFDGGDTVDLKTQAGNITVTSSTSTNVTVDQITGTETKLSAIDANGDTVVVNPEDKPRVELGGGVQSLDYKDAQIDDGTVDFDITTSGDTTLTLYGLSGFDEYRVVDSNGNVVDGGITNATGVATVTVSTDGSYRLDANSEPTMLSATPDGNVDTRTPTLEVEVDDPEFRTSIGDTVNVTFYVKGAEVGNGAVTSKGTVSEQVDLEQLDELGQVEWSAVVTDAAGEQVVVNRTLGAPGELTIRNETDPSEIINQTTVDVTIIDSDGQTYNRTTSDGTISLDGLPTDEEFTIRMSASGYVDRSAVIDSVFQVNNVFLLPSSARQSLVEFRLEDNTGNFPQDSAEILVQKTLEVSGKTKYRTIAGAEVEATGSVLLTLQTGEEYRLLVRNEEGDVRILGSYEARGDATETLEVGAITFDIDQERAYIFAANLVGTGDDRHIKIRYDDRGDLTSEVDIKIYRNGNQSRLVDTVSATTGPYGTVTAKIPIKDSAPEDATYEVVLEAQRDGETIEVSESVGGVSNLGNGFGVDSDILEIIGYVTLVAVTGLLVILSSPVAAIMATVVAGILTGIGILPISPVAVALSGAVGVLSYLGRANR